jgi:diguanylate cyclase (GGDEF)-like protein
MSNVSTSHPREAARPETTVATATIAAKARSNPRILVVDDVDDNRIILARRFQRRNFDIVEADCGAKALELIDANSFDLVLLDVTMPDISGLEVLRRIRLAHTPASLPVIMVTANSQSSDIVEALEIGANDYVAKPVDFAVALARVNAQVERKRASEALALANKALSQTNDQLEQRVSDRTARLIEANQLLKNEISSRERSEAQSQYLAYHDALTGLGNRLLFREQLQRALRETTISHGSLAILFIDLDGFKNVNDTLGHSVGDALLKLLAGRMLDNMGDSVRIARLGGDEFGILDTSPRQPEGAVSLANQVIELISAPCRIDIHNLTVSASVGISVRNGENQDVEFLLKSADLAMYRAKAAGRGVYRVFDPEMDASAQAALLLKIEMRNALVNGDFDVHYQPIISIDSRRVTGFEALARWNHRERGWIPPSEFIPVAEDTGLIVQLGEWVLRKACAEAIAWPSTVKVAVNLSPVQFKAGNLVAIVVNALASSGLEPARLELEITEMVLLDKTERNTTTLQQLRELGVRISMDDFGTGFSSLSYLRNFPFDKIKIDQSFVNNLAHDGRSQTIVSAIAGLGLSFGMATTAEGVETEEQMECLVVKGCTEVQGKIYSMPVPGAEVLPLIQSINAKE